MGLDETVAEGFLVPRFYDSAFEVLFVSRVKVEEVSLLCDPSESKSLAETFTKSGRWLLNPAHLVSE